MIFANKCHLLSEIFKDTHNTEIGKSHIAKLIKNESNIQRKYENFEGDMKRKRIAKYGIINDVLYDGRLNAAKQVFAKLMEQCCRRRHLKKRFGLRQKKIVREARDLPIITVKTLMEQLIYSRLFS